MKTVVVPLLVGVGGAAYYSYFGGETGSPDSPNIKWDWGVTGVTSDGWAWQTSSAGWRGELSHEPANGDAWKADTPPGSVDGFEYDAGPVEQVTTLPQFKDQFTAATSFIHGLRGALSVRSFGFAVAHTVDPRATNPRLRVEYARYAAEGGDATVSRGNPISGNPTFEPEAADPNGWSTLSVATSGGVTTTTREHSYAAFGASPALDNPSDGYTGHRVSWWAQAAGATSGYRLRMMSVRMWAVYDVPPAGQWPLRQRQSLPGSPSWPLRQRQNGAASGGWPLRQRQRGA